MFDGFRNMETIILAVFSYDRLGSSQRPTNFILLPNWDAFAQRCSLKSVFLKSFQNSQENISARVCLLRKLQASA